LDSVLEQAPAVACRDTVDVGLDVEGIQIR